MKEYRGRHYAVSCRQLAVHATKEASSAAANAWWEAKRAELDALSTPDPVLEVAIRNHRAVAEWFKKNEVAADEQQFYDLVIERLKKLEIVQADGGRFRQALDAGIPAGFNGLDPVYENWSSEIRDIIKTEIWRDRIKQQQRTQHRGDDGVQTIGTAIRTFLEKRKLAVSPSCYVQYRCCLFHFQEWIGVGTKIKEITGARLEDYHTELLRCIEAHECSRKYALARLSLAKQLIRWLWEREECDLPRNLGRLEIRQGTPTIKVFTVEELKLLIDQAEDRLRLYLLLMANCGMTQKDIADLRHSEVDWKRGRITRRRSKTASASEKVPCVDYKLWPTTFALLKRQRNKESDRVLLNEAGGPLWWDGFASDGRYQKNDNIKSAYFRFVTSKKITSPKPLKLIRKTSASLLESHSDYGRYVQYFLGHAPTSIAERHYVQPSAVQFDKAIDWLRVQYGV